MTDKTVVQMGENSPEYIAFRLMHYIAASEKRTFGVASDGWTPIDREYTLTLYGNCLNVVKGGTYRAVKAAA